ncbi:hypothetical protein JX265_014047, partial [Neoarthrinium moseri]
EGDAVLVDCSLHEAPEFERLRGGYTPSQVDKFCLGSLADVDGPSLAWTVYGKLLAPLSALVVVFVDDLGGLARSAQLLARWVCRQPAPCGISPRPRLVVVAERPLSKMQTDRFLDETLGLLRRLSPEQPPTLADAKTRFASCFEGVRSLGLVPDVPIVGQLLQHADEILAARRRARHDFSSGQYRRLFGVALERFVDNSPFHILQAYRPPAGIETRLQELCQLVAKNGTPPTQLLGSALLREVAKQQIPDFAPEEIFDRLFMPPMLQVQDLANIPGLASQVRDAFGSLASQAFTRPSSNHLALLKGSRGNVLPCRHGFCDDCIRSESDDSTGLVFTMACPLCGKVDSLPLKPVTACVRVLVLPGNDVETMLLFLRELQQQLFGDVRDYFDLVVCGREVSHAITQIFCLKTSIHRSLKELHTKRLRSWKRHRGEVPAIGPRQRKVAIVEECHRPRELGGLVPNAAHGRPDSRHAMAAESECDLLWPGAPMSNFVVHDTFQTVAMARRLTALLLYLEVADVTSERRLPCRVPFRVRCRLAPGCHLQNLMLMLRDRGAKIWFGCNKLASCEPFCGEEQLEDLRNGKEYSRRVDLWVPSVDSMVQLRVGTDTWQENASRCPFKFLDLVRQQSNAQIGPAKESEGCESPKLPVIRHSETLLRKELDTLHSLLNDMLEESPLSG